MQLVAELVDFVVEELVELENCDLLDLDFDIDSKEVGIDFVDLDLNNLELVVVHKLVALLELDRILVELLVLDRTIVEFDHNLLVELVQLVDKAIVDFRNSLGRDFAVQNWNFVMERQIVVRQNRKLEEVLVDSQCKFIRSKSSSD